MMVSVVYNIKCILGKGLSICICVLANLNGLCCRCPIYAKDSVCLTISSMIVARAFRIWIFFMLICICTGSTATRMAMM